MTTLFRSLAPLALTLAFIPTAGASELTRPGKVAIEGTFGFTARSGEQTLDFDGETFDADLADESIIELGVVAGGFVSEGFFLGGRLGVTSVSTSLDNDDTTLETSDATFVVAVVPRYYLALSEARETFLRLGGHVGYYSVSSESDDGESVTESGASGFGFQLDAAFVITFGADAGGYVHLGARFAKQFLEGDDDTSGEQLDVTSDRTDIGLEVGAGFYF